MFIVCPGLLATPSNLWLPFVPLLLSRLCHPNPFVRSELLSLIVRLGQQHPHVLLFPLVVGKQIAVGNQQVLKVAQLDQIRAEIDTCSASVSASSSFPSSSPAPHSDDVSQSPHTFTALLTRTETLVHELNRVASLPEDTWLVKLRQLQACPYVFAGGLSYGLEP